MHAATFTAVVVLPTPPFWFAIAYTVPIRVQRTGAPGRTRALARGPAATAPVGAAACPAAPTRVPRAGAPGRPGAIAGGRAATEPDGAGARDQPRARIGRL